MSRMSGGARSVTACARVARTAAERASYCCAPARASSPANANAAKTAKALARDVRACMLEARLEVGCRFLHRHLRRRGVAPMLVFEDAFLEPPITDHEAMRDADELLV